MNKKLVTLVLSGALLCSLGAPALAAESTPPASAETGYTENVQPLPDSLLYYGTVKEILTGEDGKVTALYMSSPQSEEFVMNLSDQTFWIDSGKRAPSTPDGLAVGEGLYVFHSPISTRSLPPQSAAFAVVRNAPQDVGCATYHKVEAVEEKDGVFQITTDNGGLLLYADGTTPLSTYTGSSLKDLSGLKVGSHLMAWYDVVALSYPGQAYVQHIMVLDQEEDTQAPGQEGDVQPLSQGENARTSTPTGFLSLLQNALKALAGQGASPAQS